MSINQPCIVPANRKGGVVLIHDNFRFVRNKKQKNNISWRCSKPTCSAYLQMNLFDVMDSNAVIQGTTTILPYFVSNLEHRMQI